MKGEKLIKSKNRVKNHGEVFTPKRIVHKMINQEGIKESLTDIRKTILEPSVGEGVFLCEILKKRLDYILANTYDIIEYENESLIAISSLYGIELLEDNAQKCVTNIYEVFLEYYIIASNKYNKNMRDKIKNSAKTIIASNIVQGDFLKEIDSYGNTLVFSEWKEIKSKSNKIKIQRTEYTLDDIRTNNKNDNGILQKKIVINNQLSFFDDKEDATINTIRRYVPVFIENVYKEEIEEILDV